ncbi:hypothetical protein HU200_026043 [Digitaria exilis]|uniref:DUF6598 domain-containing protein n=1 Tax=Digitaria exilis TaxID=1010633 RepID=A0A835BYM2_9POAL|nr:hypothetical protein HU200_026043 [Digitaria exilis]
MQEPCLVLTGPSRAVVLIDPLTIEVHLKVKGPTELEDKTLCFFANDIKDRSPFHSCLLHQTWTSKFSTLEFILGHITSSVEATMYVRVVDGSWPDGFHGQFAVCRSTSLNHNKIVLLSFGDDKVPVSSDGVIELSRRVVSAEVNSRLIVSVKAWQDDNIVEARVEFSANKSGRSFGVLDIGSCKIDVTIAWSLISVVPEHRAWSQ